MKWKAVVCGALLSAVSAVPADAAVMGNLNIDSGSYSVYVGLTFVDWEGPVVPGPGQFDVGGGTNLTSAAGNPAPGQTGMILDLTAATPTPLVNFMTFNSQPGLGFDLLGIGPGSANTNCAGLAIGQSCSPFVGSPFVLTQGAGNNTFVALRAFGTAHDGTTPSNWDGAFTTQLAGWTPLSVQQFFGCTPGMDITGCTNFTGSIQSTYSGSFIADVIPVPEPATLGLLGFGLLAAARVRRRRK